MAIIFGTLLFISTISVIGYCFVKNTGHKTDLEDENNKKDFDVFISYSKYDKTYVEDLIVPKLELGSSLIKYKCLLQIRDFEPGMSIMDQIERAVQSSSCTLIVLSKDFLKSQWACNG